MLNTISKLFLKLIGGSRNDRIIRAHLRFVREQINPLEERMRALSDEQVRDLSAQLAGRLREGEARSAVRPEAFALIREASRRARNHRQFDMQLVAGAILDDGWIAEEATGEGKTIACYPAIYMAALQGLHVHVVTVNDYLVQRDAEFAGPVFEMLGMQVGYITAKMDNAERQKMYACHVTYGTNSEFGFDYLRDNMKLSTADQVQGPLDFAIVDEVDSILIDEARTPLIISGPAYGQTDRYRKVDAVAREIISRNRSWDRANKQVETLKRNLKALRGELSKAKGTGEEAKVAAKVEQIEQQLAAGEQDLAGQTKYYEVELDKKSAHLTHEGVTAAQEIAGVGSFYVGANMEWPHLMEQALRAHLVFEKDKDYVVQEGKVIIVDEFTGRLLEGREWSDGLHQAVDAKERVTIKEENQTLATITLQNYFKLYKKLAGMTGTAMTEAGEFMKIYKLDVAAVPTHRPVNRADFDDRIYAGGETGDGAVQAPGYLSDVHAAIYEVSPAKYNAIVEEIDAVSKKGRPVLVGTTSVEKSELISALLTRTHGTQHEVLNARPENAAREADIVRDAGWQRPLKKGSKQMVGNVTIATNMAGRGTDIKLGPGVVWDNCKVPPAEKLAELGMDVEALFPPGSNKCCIHCPQYDAATNCAHCFKTKVDPAFPARGRGACRTDVPCGLHIVGTERHEARRIDNQLRGRAGRQGDPGSSRFFLSIRDELMAIFAGEWTLKVLSWLGLQGDVAIEDRRISKGVERAQRKVEERNFEVRKNLLEYDEVMDHQRKTFYSQRQRILEGRDLENMVRDMVHQAVDDGVDSYLDGHYHERCIAEWARQALQIPVRDDQVRAQNIDDLPALEDNLRRRAKEEADSNLFMTLGEYMDEDADPRDWDLRGLSSWAMSRFGVNLSQNQLRKMDADEIARQLSLAASQRIDEINLSGLTQFLEEDFARRALGAWVQGKFAIELSLEDLAGEVEDVRTRLHDKIDRAYAQREVEYPVEYALDMTLAHGGLENVYSATALAEWANRKYGLILTADELREMGMDEARRRLVAESQSWLAGDRLERFLREQLGSDPGPQQAIELVRSRFDTELGMQDFDGDVFGVTLQTARKFLRREMNELERFVLLQIVDSSWKDHLLAMDHLKSAIGLRSYAEQDPRVAYKREGGKQFQDMLAGVRDKVTDMIFKVKLSAEAQVNSVYQISSAVHEQLQGYDHLAQDMADQAAAATPQKIETIRRDVPRVGRNDPCPCGSGKKFKKCCGKDVE